MVSSPCAACATSYHFESVAPPRLRSAFSQFVPIVNSAVSVFASGSNHSTGTPHLVNRFC
ncbi:DUF1010 domain-containing protein [Simplicispira hankyongi]|uniref:DUF1010 domain-containing protein n=1 Tax=Simplicispira hankyongi TaxID=2315688 RepID=A0A398CCM9_9BURK|nr:DUF1010 domain-containing protein [Simplicispira hankyongi]RIE00155.1 DUF1010 domain-containing protein [Simplicispira hankyongi]